MPSSGWNDWRAAGCHGPGAVGRRAWPSQPVCPHRHIATMAWRIRRLRYLDDGRCGREEIWLDAAPADALAAPRICRSRSTCIIARRSGSGSPRPRTGGLRHRCRAGRAGIGLPAGRALRPVPTGSAIDQAGARPEISTHMVRSGARASMSRAAAERRGDAWGHDTLRRDRLRHDGAGAHAQHRACSTAPRSPRSSSPIRAWRRWPRGSRPARERCDIARGAAGAPRPGRAGDRPARTTAMSTSSRRSPRTGPLPLLVEKPLFTAPADAAAAARASRPAIRRRSGWRWNTATCRRSPRLVAAGRGRDRRGAGC